MIPFAELFRVFGRIGLLSFGGPAAQIALMHKELVEDRKWLEEDGFLRALSFCMMLPGPEAMQLATYAGWRLRGTLGGLISGGLFVLPGALIIACLTLIYARFGDVPLVQAAMSGIKATVVVVVAQALIALSRKTLTNRRALGLAFLAFVGLFALGLPFPVIVLGAGLFGALSAPVAAQLTDTRAAIVTPPGRIVTSVLTWIALWLLPLVALSALGFSFLAELGWFFAKLAVVTFGGAYAVLAYMSQTVVEDYGWITSLQMIDALGLAETTPGPLILVTQFVAMLSGALQGGLGLALAAGAVALWATFVPCFLWIFTAAPFLERITGHRRLGAALKAITCAVVGVILNLSTWFFLLVVFDTVTPARFGPVQLPVPDAAGFDPVAVGLIGCAAVLLAVMKLPLVRVLPLMAAIGCGAQLL